jgi:hypothetical protein
MMRRRKIYGSCGDLDRCQYMLISREGLRAVLDQPDEEIPVYCLLRGNFVVRLA